jgi:hypothetical protein
MKLLAICLFLFLGTAFAQETNTAIGLTLSPGFSAPRYMNHGEFTSEHIESIKALESGLLGLSGDVFFQYKLHDRIFVNWGLGLRSDGYRSTIYSEFTPTNEAVSSFAKYAQYRLRLEASGKFRLYNTFYTRIGVGVSVFMGARKRIEQTYDGGNYFHVGQDNRGFKEGIGTATLGFGYELKLGEKINLVTEMYGTYGFTKTMSIVSPALDIGLDRIPMQVGISVGIIRYF